MQQPTSIKTVKRNNINTYVHLPFRIVVPKVVGSSPIFHPYLKSGTYQ